MRKGLNISLPNDLPRLGLAIGMFVVTSMAVLMAGSARVTQTPTTGGNAGLEAIAPGALGRIRFELAQVGSKQVELDPALAHRTLSGLPLASDPFTALAATDMARNPKGSARDAALLKEAIRRDPRSRTARILLLRHMAATGDLEGAFDQLAVFSRLSPGLVARVMDAITGRIDTPEKVDEALAAIDPHRSLYGPFVERMASKRKSPEVVRRLAEGLPTGVKADSDIRTTIIKQLVQVGEYATARNIWQKGNAAGASGLIHSPDFSDAKAPPPFNWELAVNSTGAAERGRSGGLSVVYYDRNPGALAEQLLTLTPGAYRAVADFEVLAGTADNVHLKIACNDSAATLADAAFVARKPGANRLAINFIVPLSSCAGQRISILGTASEERGETQLQIRRIDLVAAGGGQ